MSKPLYLTILLLLTSLLSFAQQAAVKGQIRSADGQPVTYASIQVAGKSQGTRSDQNGNYQLSYLAGTHVLRISAVGYLKKQVNVVFRTGEVVVINIVLDKAESQLNDVVITGVSRATAARKNPVPLMVLNKKAMDQQANSNLIDAVVKGVPGVSAVTTGPNVSKPFIRGLGYNRVLTLYDGIRQEGQQWGDEHGIEIDQYGIGRAEVIKGPASLLYGSDAIAGVINMIPVLPSNTDNGIKGDYTADFHTNNGLIASSLGLGLKQNDWRYSFRASGKMAHNYHNRFDGYVYGTAYQEYNLTASARVDKKWGYTQLAVTAFDNLQEIPDGSRDSLTRRFTRQVLDDGDDIKERPVVPVNELKSYQLNPLHQHIQHYRLYTSNEFKLGGGSINFLAAGQQSIRREYNHPTQPKQAGLYVVLNTLNYDLKYNLPDLNNMETTLGVNGMLQANRSKDATDFPIPDYELFDIGAFLFVKKSIGLVDLSGGIRYDNRSISWNDFYVGDNPDNGFQQKAETATAAGANLQFPAFRKQYSGISGSLGLTYNITERLLLKANIARGYRAPNITEIGSNGLDPGAHIVYLGNRSFKPEFNLQQDIGLMAWLTELDISAELFNNNISNYIYQARLNDANGQPVVIVPGNSTYQYQQSAARLYGAELSLNLHPSVFKGLTFNNSLAYVKGLNKNQELISKYGDDARYLPFIPPLHYRSELKYTWKEANGILAKPYIKVELDAYASQNRFYALDNTETFTPGYQLWNIGMGAGIHNRAGKTVVDLFLQAENIFDKAYQSNLNRLKYFEYFSASPNGRSGIYNMGRNISIKVIVPF